MSQEWWGTLPAVIWLFFNLQLPSIPRVPLGCAEGQSPFAEGLGVSWAHAMRPYRDSPWWCSGTLPGSGVSPDSSHLPPSLGDQEGWRPSQSWKCSRYNWCCRGLDWDDFVELAKEREDQSSGRLNGYLGHHHVLQWLVPSASGDRGNGPDDVHAFNDLAKDSVAAIQGAMLWAIADIELR